MQKLRRNESNSWKPSVQFSCCSVVSGSLQPHESQHARLPCPSQTPRKSESEVSQSCLTLCNPVDYSLPGSSIPGIFQARILEWVAISFSRRFSQLRNWTQISHTVGFTTLPSELPGRSITNSQSLLKLMSIDLVMPSNYRIFCHLLLPPPSIFPSIRAFSNKSLFCIRWPKY